MSINENQPTPPMSQTPPDNAKTQGQDELLKARDKAIKWLWVFVEAYEGESLWSALERQHGDKYETAYGWEREARERGMPTSERVAISVSDGGGSDAGRASSQPPAPSLPTVPRILEEKDAGVAAEVSRQNTFHDRLHAIHACLKGRYPFITTIESGLDAAAWERECLRDALRTAVIELELTRQALDLYKRGDPPRYREESYAKARGEAWDAIYKSRFAFKRHLSEEAPKSDGASGSPKSGAVRGQVEGELWKVDEKPNEGLSFVLRDEQGNPLGAGMYAKDVQRIADAHNASIQRLAPSVENLGEPGA